MVVGPAGPRHHHIPSEFENIQEAHCGDDHENVHPYDSWRPDDKENVRGGPELGKLFEESWALLDHAPYHPALPAVALRMVPSNETDPLGLVDAAGFPAEDAVHVVRQHDEYHHSRAKSHQVRPSRARVRWIHDEEHWSRHHKLVSASPPKAVASPASSALQVAGHQLEAHNCQHGR